MTDYDPLASEAGQAADDTAAADEKQPSRKPSFASTEDDPLATAGTGGSQDPKGRTRPGVTVVPADSDEFERREQHLDEAESRSRVDRVDENPGDGQG